jgi:hypothetical protein
VRAAVAPANHAEVASLDQRLAAKQPFVLSPERVAALDHARAQIPDLQVDFDQIVGSPKWVRSQRGFLTGPRIDPFVLGAPNPFPGASEAEADDPHEPAKRFLNEQAALFGHGAEVLASAQITREFVGEHNGLRTVVWEQRLDGIPLFQAVLIAHITRQGELVNLTSLFLPEVEKAARLDQGGRAALLAAPPISARQAVVQAIRSSMVPQAGGITSLLGFGPEDGLAVGDQLQRFVNLSSSYVTYTYQGASGWYRTAPLPSIPLEPQPAVGESFWIIAPGSRTWTRTYSVWP